MGGGAGGPFLWACCAEAPVFSASIPPREYPCDWRWGDGPFLLRTITKPTPNSVGWSQSGLDDVQSMPGKQLMRVEQP